MPRSPKSGGFSTEPLFQQGCRAGIARRGMAVGFEVVDHHGTPLPARSWRTNPKLVGPAGNARPTKTLRSQGRGEWPSRVAVGFDLVFRWGGQCPRARLAPIAPTASAGRAPGEQRHADDEQRHSGELG